MTTYKQIQNLKTGEKEFLFTATLLKIGENIIQNSNKKDYKIVTLGFKLPNGEKVQRTAICYASNYDYGIEEGENYLSNLSFTKEGEAQLSIRLKSLSLIEQIKEISKYVVLIKVK